MKTLKKYRGVVVPMVSPFTGAHQLDHSAVEKIFRLFRNNGVHPFVLGTTGESASVPFSMKKEYLRLAGRLKDSGTILYAGIASNAISESIDLARQSFDCGVDVVVATLPSYYALTEADMLRYFEELAGQVRGPLMIYNIPATTHMSIPLEVIDRLSHHPNIVGVKDSERNEERLQASIQLWKSRKDFSHFLGWAARSADALLAGSDGLVPSTGNIQPGLYAELYRAAMENDRAGAETLQQLSDALGNVYQQGKTLGESLWALKVIMKELGLCTSHVLPPIYEQEAGEEKRLREAYQAVMVPAVKQLP